MATDSNTDWLATLPEAFKHYSRGRRVDEVECIVPDIAGISRGKAMPGSKYAKGGRSFLPISIFYQTITGAYAEADIKDQWTESDMVLVPDPSTASAIPWSDDVTMQIIHDLETVDGKPVAIAPRNVLKRVIGLYAKKGWHAIVAPEIEFYLTKPNEDPNDPIEPPVGRTGRTSSSQQAYSMIAVDEYGKVIDDIYDYAEAQGLEIDTLIQEGGAGQVEINLQHGDPLRLADQMFYFKRLIREAAYRNGYFATFMAKPMRDQPGSAMHIHQSILDTKTGDNIFTGKDGKATDLFYNFIGGLQKHSCAALPIFAPYVNSYRRFQADESSPANLEWSYDNRTTGIRIPISDNAARRVENRIVGIDTNPYLAIAANMACGYLGMVNNEQPSKARAEDAYADGVTLPRSLATALELMDADDGLQDVLGPEFCAIYRAIKTQEDDEYRSEITAWERAHLQLNV